MNLKSQSGGRKNTEASPEKGVDLRTRQKEEYQMPKVGSKKFPYTSSGVQKAQKHARATGQRVDMAGYKKGGTKKTYKTGGKVKKKKGGKVKLHHGGRVSGGMKDKQC